MSAKYDFANLKGDITGGVTAGVVALPLALAFGVQSGMGAIAGLYGAMALGMFAAIFGGTATQVSGPTGPMTVISAIVITTAIEATGSLAQGMGIIIGAFLLAGGFQILFGLLRIGKYIKYIPYPVLSGFMSGIGVIIILYQLYPLFGHPSAPNTVAIFTDIARPLSNLNGSATGLGLVTIAIIYVFPRITKAVPSTLVALFIASFAAFFMDLEVPLIGDIPSGLPALLIGEVLNIDISAAWMIIEFAAMLAALGMIDSLLTSVIADNITKTKHNSNKELIGQGIGNIISGMIGGLPGAGATMRTVVNINSGGRTRLSGVIHGLLLLFILLGIGEYAAYIPLTVLAGILITVGIGIIDYRGLKHLARVPVTDAFVMVLVLAITVFGNLINAVGIGVMLACVLFMKKSSDLAESGTSLTAMGGTEGEPPWSDEKGIYSEYRNRIYIKHIYGPMFFGFTTRFQELVKSLDNDIRILVIRMDRVPYVDQSGLYALEEAILQLEQKEVHVLMTGLHVQPRDMLKRIDIIPDLVPENHLFDDFNHCEDWIHSHIQSNSTAETDTEVGTSEPATTIG
ncbi:MAG: SulP family inorganic anion transporter [Candidatus Latescibacteria bacterium]|jgi:sulfate permease, SulP family|nr:SulP family inorganic anion transporter [Candidatus Latescibacterota bacterium]